MKCRRHLLRAIVCMIIVCLSVFAETNGIQTPEEFPSSAIPSTEQNNKQELSLLLDSSDSDGSTLMNEFQYYMKVFEKSYRDPEEFEVRFLAWLKSRAFILKYRDEHPKAQFQIGFNTYSDRTEEENKAMFGLKKDITEKISSRRRRRSQEQEGEGKGWKGWLQRSGRFLQGFRKRDRPRVEDGGLGSDDDESIGPAPHIIKPRAGVPLEVDWRDPKKNPLNLVAVTPVKNQGLCGACWAFSSAAAIEGAVAANTKILNELSVQQLIDCVQQNDGCNGGDFDYAFKYSTKGLASSSDYRFAMQQSQTCDAAEYPVASKIQKFYEIDVCDASSLQDIVATRPVAVAVDGSCDAFIHYSGGIFNDGCGQELNHAVTIVGYGSDPQMPEGEQDYWIIKNSWGRTWGEKGYGRVARNWRTGPPCGVSQIEEYGFYAVGGAAFVNGTGFFNDDSLSGSERIGLLQKILHWKYLTVLLGFAIGLLAIPILITAFKACCRSHKTKQSKAGGASSLPNRRVATAAGGGSARVVDVQSQPPPQAAPWSCPQCTYLNPRHLTHCQMCGN